MVLFLDKEAVDKEALRLEENKLREQVAALSVEQKRKYYAQELKHIKDPDTYAALNWIFVMGLHHFYLGKLLNDFKLDQNTKSSKFFRIINEVPTILLILVVFIVIFKPI